MSHHQKPKRKGSSISTYDLLEAFDILPEAFFAVKEEVTPLAVPKVMIVLAIFMFTVSVALFGGMFHYYRTIDVTEIVHVVDYDNYLELISPCGKGEGGATECGFTCELLSAVPARDMHLTCHGTGNSGEADDVHACNDMGSTTGFGGTFDYTSAATATDRTRVEITMPTAVFFKTYEVCLDEFNCTSTVTDTDVTSGQVKSLSFGGCIHQLITSKLAFF